MEGYLEDCINSILAEIKDVCAEIICIDDCSTDNSWVTLNKICSENDVCSCYRNEENRGVSFSRNRAIKLAKGDYIWFVDPDDLLYSGTVKEFLKCAKQTDADIALGNYLRVEESFSLKDSIIYEKGDVVFNETKKMLLPTDDSRKGMCAVWAGLFRRNFLLDNELFFREDMIAQEDTLFYYEIEQYNPRIIKTEACCYLYRQRSSSVMHRKSERRMQNYYRSMKIMLDVYKEYLSAGKYNDREILEAKILHSYENVFSCLAKCTDKKFVKKEFSSLKKSGYYPYPFRKETLQRQGSKIIAILDYLLPIEICFWMVHFIYTMANRRRFKQSM